MAGYSVPDFSWLYQGLPASGGSLYVYQTGTTTPVTIYSDGGLTTPITNPGTLDANGALKFYVSGSVNLRLDAYTATGQFIQSIDPVYPVSGTTASTGMVVYEGSNFTLSTTNNGNNIISTAAINIALPLTSTFTNTFQVELNAQGGAITLIPNSADKINGQAAGVNYVIPKGGSALLWTDAAGNWGLNFLSVGATTSSFNAITGCLPTAFGGSTNANATITVSSGIATDSTNSVNIICAGYSWAVANGNVINGYSGGATLPSSAATYHMYLCTGTTGTGVYLVPNSSYPLAAASAPTGYNSYVRRIFSFNTNSSGLPLGYTADEVEGGAIVCWLAAETVDQTNPALTTAGSLLTLPSVPLGLKMQYIAYAYNSSGSIYVKILSASEPVSVPSASTGDVASNSVSPGVNQVYAITNTSGQIRAVASGSTSTLTLTARAVKDFRRN